MLGVMASRTGGDRAELSYHEVSVESQRLEANLISFVNFSTASRSASVAYTCAAG